MSKFIKGDKVRCVEEGFYTGIDVGDSYTVDSSNEEYVYLKGHAQFGYFHSRFELVTELTLSVELTPLLSQLRVYEAGKSYANRDEYTGIVTVQYLDATTVYLSGAHGDITDDTRKLAFTKLKAIGIKHVKYEHNGLQHTVDI